jgi:hypothetical protein
MCDSCGEPKTPLAGWPFVKNDKDVPQAHICLPLRLIVQPRRMRIFLQEAEAGGPTFVD